MSVKLVNASCLRLLASWINKPYLIAFDIWVNCAQCPVSIPHTRHFSWTLPFEIYFQAAIKEGFLLKQTWSFQRWRRRYFRLKGHTLFYAKGPNVSIHKNRVPNLKDNKIYSASVPFSFDCFFPPSTFMCFGLRLRSIVLEHFLYRIMSQSFRCRSKKSNNPACIDRGNCAEIELNARYFVSERARNFDVGAD